VGGQRDTEEKTVEGQSGSAGTLTTGEFIVRVVPLIIAAVVLAAIGSLVVWQRSNLTARSYEIGQAETDLRKLEEQNRVYRAELSRLTSHEEIRRRVEDWGIPLMAPGEAQRSPGSRN
jgi:hypothetical protein